MEERRRGCQPLGTRESVWLIATVVRIGIVRGHHGGFVEQLRWLTVLKGAGGVRSGKVGCPNVVGP